MPPADASLAIENARLSRNLKSVTQRARTMERALNAEAKPGEPIMTARRIAMVGRLIDAAIIAEQHGEVPVIQFARDRVSGEIIGIHLALVEREDTGCAPLTGPVEYGGMAVEA